MTSDNPEFHVCNLALDFPENSSAFIKSDWCNTSFAIILFDGVCTWTGEMQSDVITTLSDQLGLSVQQYVKECRNAFSTKGKDKGFIYILKDDTFQWKKESLDMRISFGQISLEKTPVVRTLHKIINEMLNENSLFKEKLGRIEGEKMNLMADNKHLIETLEESNNLKSKMENDLFSRFLKVLNTKKEKINELKKHTLLKGQGDRKESDNMSKYECDTDVDSDSDEEGDGDNASSASDKEDRSKLADKESDSDEQLNKCPLLPKRNRLANSKKSLPNKQVETQNETNLVSDKGERVQGKQSKNHRREPTKIQVVPSTSSCLPKKVHRSVAFSFVDSDEESEDNIKVLPSDKKLISSPKNEDNSSFVMHSPKKHGRFRNQLVGDEIFKLSSENGPSAKVPKIEKKCVSDESDSSVKSIEINNHRKIHREPEACVKNSESSCSENNGKETKVSVKDLIDGLFG